MKKWLLIWICFFSACCLDHTIYAQAELVPNNGFETIAVCPVGFSQFEDFVATWVDPNTASPDYMNACANPFPTGVPKNGTGYQTPHSGDAYAGIYTFSGTLYREFIQVQLISPLTAGTDYAFSMYVVLHNKSNTAIDDLGVYFSVTAPTAAGTGMLAGAPLPQISNPFGAVITDTLNWTFISGTYTATGGEQYLTIGHLKPDAATTYQPVPFGSQGAYYYIDDVSLQATLLPITLSSFEGECINDAVAPAISLEWKTVSEINNCCFEIERSADGFTFNKIGTINGNGNSTTEHTYVFYDQMPFRGMNYYRLKQIDFNGSISYSKIILVRNDGYMDFIVTQNGNSISFQNKTNEILLFEIFSSGGVKQIQYKIPQGNTTLQVNALTHGIYFYAVRLESTGEFLRSGKLIY